MEEQIEISKKIWEIFARPKPRQRKHYKAMCEENMIPEDAISAGIKRFSPFDKGHAIAADKASKLFETVSKKESDEIKGIEKAISLFEKMYEYENPDLLYFAFESYLTHDIKDYQFRLPSIMVGNPELVIPSRLNADPEALEVAVGSAEETKLDWFREDPLLNEHHGHWHIVYNTRRFKDRQGEMFFYMHRQMLARYDAERLAEKVGQVIPFDNMDDAIKVGYTAGEDGRISGSYQTDRNPDQQVSSNDSNTQKAMLQRIRQDINGGDYDVRANETNDMKAEIRQVNLLGSTIESNIQSLDKNYAGYHGYGHMFISDINAGVMGDTQTAIRDVVFWEWHKGIDNIYELFTKRFPKYRIFNDAPDIELRKFTDENDELSSHDIIICKTSDIENYSLQSGNKIGQSAFGGDRWEENFSSGTFTYDEGGNRFNIKTTDELTTSMKTSTMTYIDDNGEDVTFPFEYLVHDPFCYFIRVENNSLEQKQVTVRIFIVPAESAEDHEKWIEMDKFLYEMAPKSKNVIFRADELSSVIRKPVIKDPSEVISAFNPVDMFSNFGRCDCGWPYHLLLPKGNADGMKFQIMVMITDGAIDLVGEEPNCGSLSFCAVSNNLYPDQRPLGYPFNRQFDGGTKPISNAITVNKNMASRSFYIKHLAQ